MHNFRNSETFLRTFVWKFGYTSFITANTTTTNNIIILDCDKTVIYAMETTDSTKIRYTLKLILEYLDYYEEVYSL